VTQQSFLEPSIDHIFMYDNKFCITKLRVQPVAIGNQAHTTLRDIENEDHGID